MTIYFVEAEGTNCVKIGFTSRSVEQRIAELQTGQPQRLRLWGSIPGECDAEQGLHKEYAALRTNGEWFSPADSIYHTIRNLIDNQLPWYHCRAPQFLGRIWLRAVAPTKDTDESAYEDVAYDFKEESLKKAVELCKWYSKTFLHGCSGLSLEQIKDLRKRYVKFKKSDSFWASRYVLAWEGQP